MKRVYGHINFLTHMFTYHLCAHWLSDCCIKNKIVWSWLLTSQHVLFLLIFQGEEQVTAEFLAGKVPEIVYKKAIQSIPGAVTYTVLLVN